MDPTNSIFFCKAPSSSPNDTPNAISSFACSRIYSFRGALSPRYPLGFIYGSALLLFYLMIFVKIIHIAYSHKHNINISTY